MGILDARVKKAIFIIFRDFIMKKNNSSKSSKGIGNTNDSLKKQISPARHWEFTLNNYTEDDISHLEKLDRSIVPIFVGQSEVGDKGTAHLQCTFSYADGEKGRPLNLFKDLLGHARCSFRKVRSIKRIRPYCCKEDRGTDERGWRFMYGWKKPVQLVKMTYAKLRPYQKTIADYFKEPCDPLFSRDIVWIWEPDGNVGKTIMSMYFCDQTQALVVGGKASDIFCGVAKEVAEGRMPSLVIFDIPRSSNGYISYKAIEKIKDGIYYSGKYESGMCRFNRPHVLCMANEPPEIPALSEDRWKVFRYGEGLV